MTTEKTFLIVPSCVDENRSCEKYFEEWSSIRALIRFAKENINDFVSLKVYWTDGRLFAEGYYYV